MADSDIIIPMGIRDIIEERAALWKNFDDAQSQLAEMEKMSSQMAPSAVARIPDELSREKTPFSEIAAAHQSFRTELTRIAQSQESIKTYQAEIKKIEQHQKTIAILVGLGIAVVLGILACGGFYVLSLILNN